MSGMSDTVGCVYFQLPLFYFLRPISGRRIVAMTEPEVRDDQPSDERVAHTAGHKGGVDAAV